MSLVSQIFSCQRCGVCCQGDTTISLNEGDRQRMARALVMPESEACKKFWRTTGSTVQMKTVESHCIFYEQGCKVHEARPWRCAQWPLHPAILTDENNFLTIANSCPGINKNISYRQFCEILQEILKKVNFSC
ncbi:MAG: YkgJ family cysteine cluster protein [Proteobacteria bacterium]|nr:YkgJ family cysteine cluster protein [Pseudomonadota bacterium]